MPGNTNAQKIGPPRSVTESAVTASASDEVNVADAGWYTFRALATTVYVLFGNTNSVASPTTSTAYPIPADGSESWYLGRGQSFRYIGAGTGTLHWFRSGG
jgi:hypothetical protein